MIAQRFGGQPSYFFLLPSSIINVTHQSLDITNNSIAIGKGRSPPKISSLLCKRMFNPLTPDLLVEDLSLPQRKAYTFDMNSRMALRMYIPFG